MRKPSAPFLAAVGLAAVVAAAGQRPRPARRRLRDLPPGARQLRHLHRRPRPDLAPVGLGLQALRRLRAESAAPRTSARPWAPATPPRPKKPGLIPVMGWQAVMHFGFHLGLTDWLEFVADLPISAEGYTAAYGQYGSAGVVPPNGSGPLRTGFYANSALHQRAAAQRRAARLAPRLQGAPLPRRHLRPGRLRRRHACRSATTRPSSATAASPSAPP